MVEELLTIKEAAELIGISEAALRRRAKNGEINSYRTQAHKSRLMFLRGEAIELRSSLVNPVMMLLSQKQSEARNE